MNNELAIPNQKSKGSVIGGMFWMFLISVLLFWMPVLGPGLAGVVGGKVSGGVGKALIAVFLPSIILGIILFAVASSLSGMPVVGAIAGAGGIVLSLVHVGPMLIGAIIGGVMA